jgi:hypothetical protein
MRVGESAERRVCGLPTAADHVRVAVSHGGATQSHNHVEGIPHHVVDLARVETRKSAPGEDREEQELGEFAWFWAFGWRRDS